VKFERLTRTLGWSNTGGVTVTEQALQLAPSERLDLIGTLWDSLLDEGVELPSSDEQRTELRRRLLDHRANPDAVMSWDEAKQRLLRIGT
jgi:putative addiction module component (TIGR02574 family)